METNGLGTLSEVLGVPDPLLLRLEHLGEFAAGVCCEPIVSTIESHRVPHLVISRQRHLAGVAYFPRSRLDVIGSCRCRTKVTPDYLRKLMAPRERVSQAGADTTGSEQQPEDVSEEELHANLSFCI